MTPWKTLTRIALFSALILAVAGCNTAAPAPVVTLAPTSDLGAVQTVAVQTVIAGLTQEAASNPTLPPTEAPTEAAALTSTSTSLPTLTPVPTLTVAAPAPVVSATATRKPASGGGGGIVIRPTATAYTDRATWVSQNLKDGISLKPGQDFDIVWTVKNTGYRNWTPDFYYAYQSGDLKPVKGDVRTIGQTVDKNDTVALRVDFIAPSQPGRYTSNWAIINDDGVAFFHMYIVINVQ